MVMVIVVIVVVILIVLVVAVMVPVGCPCPHSYDPHFHPASSGLQQWFWVLLCVVVTTIIMV